MGQNIKNKHYRRFLDQGEIETIGPDLIKNVLDSIDHNNKTEARSLLIALYLTGARPVEILNLIAKDIKKDGRYILINTPAAKNGVARPIRLLNKNPMARELYTYAIACHPEQILFYHFKGKYHRKRLGKRGVYNRIETAYKVRYWVYKWFKNHLDTGIPPYFLRHNRFSKMAEKGASDRDIMQLKGSKTFESIRPYVHLSSKKSKQLASKID